LTTRAVSNAVLANTISDDMESGLRILGAMTRAAANVVSVVKLNNSAMHVQAYLGILASFL